MGLLCTPQCSFTMKHHTMSSGLAVHAAGVVVSAGSRCHETAGASETAAAAAAVESSCFSPKLPLLSGALPVAVLLLLLKTLSDG